MEVPKSINDISQETKLDIKLFIFLIQNSIVVECNTYVYSLQQEKINNIEKRVLLSPEYSALEKEVFKLFKKYSFKQQHLHEISWSEDIPLKELDKCLIKFKDYFGVFYLPNNNDKQ